MVVVSFGGSVMKKEHLPEIGKLFSRIKPLAIVVGGGKLLDDYVSLANKYGLSKYDIDRMLIHMTYINAYLLKTFVKNSEVFYNIDTAALWYGIKRVILGGTHPGHTTDTVTALLCEKLGERAMVNITDVDGIYDKDPKKHRDARLIPRMTYAELESVIQDSREPRAHTVIDMLSLKILRRSGIELRVVNGTNTRELKKALTGKRFKGTVVTP